MDLFLSLQGRIGRGKWWLGVIALTVAQFVVAAVLAAVGFMSLEPGAELDSASVIGNLILIAIFVWPSICVTGKRFHDRDKSAWWMLIGVVPIIGFIWILIECGLLAGTPGANRFGPDPLG